MIGHYYGNGPSSSRAAGDVSWGGSLKALDRLLAGQEPVEPRHHVLEVGGVAAVDLGGHPAVVADGVEGPAHLYPVDVALAQVLPGEAAARAVELEVLEVHLGDARAQRAHPVLGIAVEDDIADVEVGLDPGRRELVHVARELDRAEQELVPDLLHGHDH